MPRITLIVFSKPNRLPSLSSQSSTEETGVTDRRKQFLKVPYGGYHNDSIPDEDPTLTHVEKGSRAGDAERA